MKFIIGVLTFCIVLFIYIHIFFHLKTGEDLEVYEIEEPSKDKLEEICDIRQPVVFDFNGGNLLENCSLEQVVSNYGAFDIKLRDLREESSEAELYIPFTMNAAVHAFNNDGEEKYISEKNGDFLDETGLVKIYQYNDAFLRPHMVSSCMYDFLTGSNNIETPFRYELSYRNFFYVTQGAVTIKLAPPKSSKYLYEIKDYDNFEFRSPVNPWNVQDKYEGDFDKIKCLELTLTKGNIIYIPAYWWHSIKFEKDTSVCVFKYRTYMNTVAIIPQLGLRLLQRQNIKREIVKKKEI